MMTYWSWLGAMMLAGTVSQAAAQSATDVPMRPETRFRNVRVGLGLAVPENASSTTQIGAEIGLGTVLAPWLELSTGLTYWSTDIDRADLGSSSTGTISDFSVYSDLRWQTPPLRRVQPYALAGLAVHRVSASIDDDRSLETALTGTEMGADLGFGARTHAVGLGWSAEFRRRFVGDVDHWNLTAGVTWTFGHDGAARPTASAVYVAPVSSGPVGTSSARGSVASGAGGTGPSSAELDRLAALVGEVVQENQRLRRELETARAEASAPATPDPVVGTLEPELHRALLDVAIAEGDPTALTREGSDFRLTLESSLFAVASTEIGVDGRGSLRRVWRVLQRYPDVEVRVEGHADAWGDAQKNMQLSDARAQSVRTELVGLGIDSSRVSAMGFGSTRPIADNATKDGRARNRRVELIFTITN